MNSCNSVQQKINCINKTFFAISLGTLRFNFITAENAKNRKVSERTILVIFLNPLSQDARIRGKKKL
jgi:hypothetical protein